MNKKLLKSIEEYHNWEQSIADHIGLRKEYWPIYGLGKKTPDYYPCVVAWEIIEGDVSIICFAIIYEFDFVK